MSLPALIVKDLKKDFPLGDRSITVLQDISVTINLGQLTMLVGPSGCGKTTFISVATGILSATSGKISLLGQDLISMSDRDKVLLRRKNIGFIFQQYNLLPALTAAENAAMPLIAAGVDHELAVKRATMILDTIAMGRNINKLPKQLSGGEQQRVAIARALVHDPRLIVCDEPTAALDAHTGHSVMETLRTIANDSSRAVLIVTHDNRIYKFADRILEMSDGSIIDDCSVDEYLAKSAN